MTKSNLEESYKVVRVLKDGRRVSQFIDNDYTRVWTSFYQMLEYDLGKTTFGPDRTKVYSYGSFSQALIGINGNTAVEFSGKVEIYRAIPVGNQTRDFYVLSEGLLLVKLVRSLLVKNGCAIKGKLINNAARKLHNERLKAYGKRVK
jgi:hypothetical protein